MSWQQKNHYLAIGVKCRSGVIRLSDFLTGVLVNLDDKSVINSVRLGSKPLNTGLVASVAIVFSIVFMHFMLLQPAGFPLTITPFSLVVFFVIAFKVRITKTTLFLGGAIVFSPFVILIEYSVLGGNADIGEFAKTYILWVSATLILWLSVRGRIKIFFDYTSAFVFCVVIILAFSSLQILVAKYLHSTVFYNPFGEFNYLGPSAIIKHVNENRVRAPAFYLEPSFCAFVLFFLISSILLFRLEVRRVVYAGLLVGILGVWWVGSASGTIAFLILAVLFKASTIKSKSLKLLAFALLVVVLVMVTLFILPSRLAEVNEEGTSGYWRLIAPTIILSKVLINFPLGVPFGQIESFVTPLGLSHAGHVGTSIDNGTYYFIFYFGWLGILFAFWLLIKITKSVYSSDSRGVVFWWYVFASLQFSGGVLLSEYVYPLILVIYAYRFSMWKVVSNVDVRHIKYRT